MIPTVGPAMTETDFVLRPAWNALFRATAFAGEFELRARSLAKASGLNPKASLSELILEIRTRYAAQLSEAASQCLDDAKDLRNDVLHAHFRRAIRILERVTGQPWESAVVGGNFRTKKVLSGKDLANKDVFGRFTDFHLGGFPQGRGFEVATSVIATGTHVLRQLGAGTDDLRIDRLVVRFRILAGLAGRLETEARMLALVSEGLRNPRRDDGLRHIVQGLHDHYSTVLAEGEWERMNQAVDLRDAIHHAELGEALRILDVDPLDGEIVDHLERLCAPDVCNRAGPLLEQAAGLLDQLLAENTRRGFQERDEHPETRESGAEIVQVLEQMLKAAKR
jgi:hypothetical protein